ncbi:peptidoglycan DD-metalloendopeptidase family protein [Alteromonas sp. 5E99-2]|uniref:peptidoglycan DD-metalloendopeptidase family protein n=1 Tax=Alteromonas sp. 5E99-2 TaxID=2817683 RepID=UPI00325AC499
MKEVSAFDGNTYVVTEGDTLYAIALYSGNDYRDIAKWNGISAPYTINAGQALVIRQISVKKPSRPPLSTNTTPTTPVNITKRVESSNQQAYGKKEKSVSQQYDTEKSSKDFETFPDRVARWVWPLRGKVIETFNNTSAGNKGIDIQAPLGSPVVSAADGKVVYTGSALRGYGNLVIVKHSETFLSAYAHNEKILVKERQWIKAGQKIATVGSSGTDTVKLHFEVRYRGKSLDPLRYLPTK